jgi:hypothetical protein
MKEGHDFRFEPDGGTLMRGKVLIDGVPLTAVSFEVDAASDNGLAYVTLKLICRSIEIKAAPSEASQAEDQQG